MDQRIGPVPVIASALETFRETGYWGPVDLLSPAECALLSRYLDDPDRPGPYDWSKGLAVTDRVIYEVAMRPQLVSLLEELLGPQIVLWGASIVDKKPGQDHAWHTDIESSAVNSQCVTAWIGLENCSVESSLKLIDGSHLFGKSLQQAAAERGIPRAGRTTSVARELARDLRPDARLVEPYVRDGQALLFDGRAWHGSLNTRVNGRRRALLLQYAAGTVPLRIPDWNHLDWPFAFTSSRPPVVAVSRPPAPGVHRIVSPPPRSNVSVLPLKSLTRPMPSPLPRDPRGGWKPYPLYRGSTPVLRHLDCHASVLEPGRSPHLPHAHLDEELLVVLEGEADVVIANAVDDPAPRVERLAAGDFIYYPSYQHHTIRCAGPAPVTYFMYRWQAQLKGDGGTPTTIVRASADAAPPNPGSFSSRLLFEGPTAFLDKLHVHRSYASHDGAGYAAHLDQHDVALLLLTGRVKTLGRTIAAPGVVFYPAGTAHGLRAARGAATYLVVEFHGVRSAPASRLQTLRILPRVLRQAVRTRLGRIKRRIEREVRTWRGRRGADR